MSSSERPVLPERRLGVSISASGRYVERGLRDLLRLARRIEELGFDMVTLGEHVVTGRDVSARGSERWYVEEVWWPDPLVTLAAVAGVTERLRLGTSVYVVPLRPAPVVAKMVASLDAISEGRFVFGVGAGWQASEFAAVGVPMRGRSARLEDSLRACKALWAEQPASFHSATVNFDEVWCLPRPARPGGPPILIAGDPGGAAPARIAELGDGWIVRTGAVHDPDEEAEKIRVDMAAIREAFAAAGRDPGQLLFQIGTVARRLDSGSPDLKQAFAQVERYWSLGIQTVNLSLAQFVDGPVGLEPFLRAAATLIA